MGEKKQKRQKKQKKVIIKFYISADDRDNGKSMIGRPSVATTVKGFRKILEKHNPFGGPYLAYFDEDGKNLGAACNAEDYLSSN